jgi:hypothetical protein
VLDDHESRAAAQSDEHLLHRAARDRDGGLDPGLGHPPDEYPGTVGDRGGFGRARLAHVDDLDVAAARRRLPGGEVQGGAAVDEVVDADDEAAWS